MGSSSSKAARQQVYPGPMPPNVYPVGHWPPPGFIPQGFGPMSQPVMMPQMSRGSTRRKRRRRSMDDETKLARDATGYATSQPRSILQNRADAPVIPGQTVPDPKEPRISTAGRGGRLRVAPTPYPDRRREIDDASSTSSSPEEALLNHPNGQQAQTFVAAGEQPIDPANVHPVQPPHGTVLGSLLPMSPVNPVVYGPTDGRPSAVPFLQNPLPDPPRDVYNLTPFKDVLNLPHTTRLLLSGSRTATLPKVRRRKKKRGFWDSLLNRKPSRESIPEADVRFVPIPVNGNGSGSTEALSAPIPGPSQPFQTEPGVMFQQQQPFVDPQTGAAFRHSRQQPAFPVSQQVVDPMMPDAANMQYQYRSVPPPAAVPVDAGAPIVPPEALGSATPAMPIPPPHSLHGHPGPGLEEFRFNHRGPVIGFLNHSNYRVLWNNQTFPTAAHVHEAMKFPSRPDLVEFIRRECEDPSQLYAVTSQMGRQPGALRADWPDVFKQCMDDVLLMKFNQHPDIRQALRNTGNQMLVYEDSNDSYWGTGSDGRGQNELGRALMRVRASDRLIVP